MRTIILLSFLCAASWSQAQFFGLSASYNYDGFIGETWRTGRGLQIGVGGENLRINETPFTIGGKYYFGYTKSRFNSILDNIAFDLPDSIPNLGFADVDYKKFSFGAEIDLGYQQWELSVIEPYVSLGARFDNYSTWLKYKLYEEDSCHCFSSKFDILTETKSFGFTSGIGIKIRPTETFYIDLRATYYGGWGLGSNDNRGIPDSDSFHISNEGDPTFNYSESNYFQGVNFHVGVIFRLNFESLGSSSSSSFNLWPSDDDDDDDNDESESSSSSSGSSSSSTPCTPITLKPASRR